ncbi:protein of unknown function (plasmid) [Azospirillum baldaniorum]|uniref:Uncharacterized protein n=1 Tax=Azospirillum baldaniorum TaxID=1064539 RepID=A0A9P1JY00_9PROT|nr:protein of unknown function [Azospirillum baldaniorum]
MIDLDVAAAVDPPRGGVPGVALHILPVPMARQVICSDAQGEGVRHCPFCLELGPVVAVADRAVDHVEISVPQRAVEAAVNERLPEVLSVCGSVGLGYYLPSLATVAVQINIEIPRLFTAWTA